MTSSDLLAPAPAFATGDRVAPRSVRAHNTSLHSENKIHDDDVARKYGFKGGLVPGITVYAYMAGPLAAVAGAHWLAHGGATVAFVSPLYEGENAISNAVVTDVEADAGGKTVRFDVWTENAAGQRCGTGSAWIGLSGKPDLVVPDYVAVDAGPAPDHDGRLQLVLESAPIGEVLPRLVKPTTTAEAREYAEGAFDMNPLFRSGSPWGPPLMHPGWLLSACNAIFAQAYLFGPWIHTGSEIRYLAPALAGRTLTFHGRLVEAYEKRRHHYATIDIFCVDDAGQPVMAVKHDAIFKVHPQE